MKHLVLFILMTARLSVFAQLNEGYEVVSVAESQKFYLNSQTRLGGTTRSYLSVSLPANTVSWIYMLTTVKASTPPALNLLPQVVRLIDKTGITGSLISSLTYPSGESTVNAYVISPNQYSGFIDGNKFSFYPSASRIAFNSGAVKVDQPYNNGQYYIGLENPAAVSGVTVVIEVVAIVKKSKPALLTVLETIQKVVDKPSREVSENVTYASADNQSLAANADVPKRDEELAKKKSQAINIGSLGWYAYERGDLNTCIEQSKKSISIYPFFFAEANLALCYLIQGNDTLAMEQYIEALNVLSKETNQKENLKGSIKDIEEAKNKRKLNAIADDILKLLQSKL